MNGLPKTDDLISSGKYFGTTKDFLANFGSAYDAVRGQVLKFEGRQDYREPGNHSLEAFENGEIQRSIDLIRESKKEDEPFYRKLAADRIEFIRVRPVKVPRTRYLQWEIENYKISEELGERIYFFHYDQLSELLEENIHHDFMIFDARFAFMHDYSEEGELRGGWVFEDAVSICKLLALFAFLKANSFNFRLSV